MSTNAANVTAGKPKIGGAIYRAPLGTTLPTTADEALNVGFQSLGYISQDGVVNSTPITSQNVKSWGGDTVLVLQTEKGDTFKFAMIEATRTEVLKTVYGTGNVTGTLETGLAVSVNAEEPEEAVYVIDTILRGGIANRLVIPRGTITAVEDITYSDSAAVGYGITLAGVPDSSGNTHYEYKKRVPGGTVTLNKSTATVAHGSTTTITATTSPAGGTVKWFSSDTDIATVTGGTVTGIAAGSAVITARVVETGATATATVTVT